MMFRQLKQLKRFLGIGVLATGVHVLTAMLVELIFDTDPLFANFTGFSTAVFCSYIGHTRATFAIQARHVFHFPRFLLVSLFGLLLSSVVTWWGVEKLGVTFAMTMLTVAFVVPLSTFVLLKFWALKE